MIIDRIETRYDKSHLNYGSATITLTSDELTFICNAIYNARINCDYKCSGTIIDLETELAICRDICKRGCLDNFTLDKAYNHHHDINGGSKNEDV